MLAILLIMALSYAHGAIQWLAADAVSTVYTVSGLAFQPKALRFTWVGLKSTVNAGSATTNERRGVGFATGTADRRCVATSDVDNSAAADTSCVYRDDAVVATVNSTPASDGMLDLNSITSDGFTVIVDDQGVVDLTVFWEAWGGSDITVAVTGAIAEPAATGNVDYTVTGFVAGNNGDQVVMFAGVQSVSAANTAESQDSGLFIGAATAGTVGENFVIAGNSDQGSATMDTDGYALGGECLAQIVVAGGNPNARATLTQFGTNNFRLNWIARGLTNRRSIFLAIKGGQWRAGKSTIDTQTLNATSTVSGLPFTPIGLALVSAFNVESTAGTSSNFDLMNFGCGSSPSSRRAMGVESSDASANAAVVVIIAYDAVMIYPVFADGTPDAAWDLNSLNADGFTLKVTDANSDPTTTWYGYLTFGNLPAARTTKNTRAFPLGTEIGMNWRGAA